MKMHLKLFLLFTVAFASIASAQTGARNIQTREVGFLDLSGVKQVDTFKSTEEGVIGVVWSCEDGGDSKRVTPATMLLRVIGDRFRVGDEVLADIGVFNLCSTPIEIPWSSEPVDMTGAQDFQAHAWLRLGLSTTDPQITMTPEFFLYGLTPATTKTLHFGDFVRLRTKSRIKFLLTARSEIGEEVSNPFTSSRNVELSAFGYYREYHPGTKHAWSGAYPTSGNFWNTVRVSVSPKPGTEN